MDRRRHTNPTMLLTTLLVISFLLMTVDVRGQGTGVTATLRTGAQSLAAPLQDAARTIVDPVVDFLDGLANLGSLRAENERLRAELNEARVAAAEADGLEERVELLERLMNLPEGDYPQIIAEVRGGTGPLDLGITINQGLEQGVVVGNPVVDENQVLIGIVTEALPNSASVRLITDPNSGVGVVTQGGAEGVLGGTGATDALELTIYVASENLPEGEVFRTSGTQAGIPAGIPVAQLVEDTAINAGAIETTAVRPLSDGSVLGIVIVLQFGEDALVLDEDIPTEEPADGPSEDGP